LDVEMTTLLSLRQTQLVMKYSNSITNI